MNVANYLAVNAVRFPHRIATYQGDVPALSYAELACQARRWATFFARQGLAPGERVALFLPNSPVYIELLCGAWYAGLVVVPVNAKLSVAEVGYIADDSGSWIVFCERDDVAQALTDTLVLPPMLPEGLVHEESFDRPVFRAPGQHRTGDGAKQAGAFCPHVPRFRAVYRALPDGRRRQCHSRFLEVLG